MSAAFDIVLAVTLIAVAYLALSGRDLFRSVVLFVTFGVMISLVWVRLQAFDLALVEVAIGAGITGALFLNALGRMDEGAPSAQEQSRHRAASGEEP